MLKAPGKARYQNVLQDFGPQILGESTTFSSCRLWKPPQTNELKKGSSLPFNTVFLGNLIFKEVFQELKVSEEAATQCTKTVKQEGNVCVLMMREEFQENLDNQLWLLPVGVVHLVTLPVPFLVGHFITPKTPDCVNELLLASNPSRASFGEHKGEADGPKLDLCLFSLVGNWCLLDSKLDQLVGAGCVASHHCDQLFGLGLESSSEDFTLFMLQEKFNIPTPLSLLGILFLQENVQCF